MRGGETLRYALRRPPVARSPGAPRPCGRRRRLRASTRPMRARGAGLSPERGRLRKKWSAPGAGGHHAKRMPPQRAGPPALAAAWT